MEVLSTVLPIVIDILLIVLLTIGIILLIKCIYIIDKAKSILLNVEDKVNSLNSLFSIVNLVSDRVALVTDKAVNFIENMILKIFKNKNEKEEERNDDYE